jgi:hypothetical protein
MTFSDPRCFACRGPFHPATGNHFADGVDYCGRCYRAFLVFYRGRMAPRKGGHMPDFYEHAATSVRPPLA